MTDAPVVGWTCPESLPAGGLHVWRISLCTGPSTAGPTGLAADEIERAQRLVDPIARRRFIALRQATRAILARYVDRDPAELAFGRETRGKPRLADPASDWVFNLTDSRDLALLAVSRAGPVGIDLEHIRPVPRREGIARRILGQGLVDALADSPPAERDALFFRQWTAFEALQKATGAGLAGPRADPADWRVHHFVPAPGCIAALAHGAEPGVPFFYFSFPD